MDGVIDGGWGFVAAAWGLSLSLFIGYALLTNLRLARARRERS